MTREEKYHFIEQYLSGKQEEKLEEVLVEHPEIEREIHFHRELHAAIADKELKFIENRINEGAKAYFDRAKKRVRRLYALAISIAAFIALFLAIQGLFQQKVSGPELYESHYYPYQAPSVFRSEEPSELDQELMLGLAAYKQMNHAEAIQHFNKFLKRNPDKDLAIFLRGISYMEIDSSVQAQKDFSAILGNQQSLFQGQAGWYAALDFIRQENFARAKEILQSLPDEARVRELLSNLP